MVITFPLPGSSQLFVKSMRWERFDQNSTMRGLYGVQTVTVIAPLWKVAMTFDLKNESQSGPYQGLLMSLEGSVNQLSLYNVGRPVPLGTYTGVSGTTAITGTTAVGATSMVLTNASYPSCTLKTGDYIGVGTGVTTQVVMVTADATSNGSGVITVSFAPALRNAMTATNATLQYPRALFRQQNNTSGWDYAATTVDGMSLDLLEDVRP